MKEHKLTPLNSFTLRVVIVSFNFSIIAYGLRFIHLEVSRYGTLLWPDTLDFTFMIIIGAFNLYMLRHRWIR